MKWTGVAARSALRRSAGLALAAQALLSGCLVNDNECSANQVALKGNSLGCACAPGAVPDPRGYGCMKCGDNEQAVAEKCECVTGYARAAAGMPCEEITGGLLGAACSAEMPCTDPYPYCATSHGESFCTTQGCTSHADCAVGWMCDTPGPGGFCRKPYGLGKSCAMSGDCAGNEAAFCESFVTMTCVIEKCASKPGICPSGNVCCDLTALVGTSLCTPSTVLMNGLCPDQKAPVSP